MKRGVTSVLGFRVTNTDPEDRYRILEEVIGDPHQDAVLIHTWPKQPPLPAAVNG
jgi:hypothetical protein